MRRNHRAVLRFEVAIHHELPATAAPKVAAEYFKNLLRLFCTQEHWRSPADCQVMAIS